MHLGASEGVLEASWDHLGRLEQILEGFGAVLEAFGDDFETIFERRSTMNTKNDMHHVVL